LPEEWVGEPGEKKKTGPKPKTEFKKQLRVLILDLYVAWLDDPMYNAGRTIEFLKSSNRPDFLIVLNYHVRL